MNRKRWIIQGHGIRDLYAISLSWAKDLPIKLPLCKGHENCVNFDQLPGAESTRIPIENTVYGKNTDNLSESDYKEILRMMN